MRVSTMTVYRIIKSGELPAVRVGRSFRVRDVDVDTYLGSRYTQAGLTVARTLLNDAYLSTDPQHQGLLLHSVYHRPNNWDYIPPGRKIRLASAKKLSG